MGPRPLGWGPPESGLNDSESEEAPSGREPSLVCELIVGLGEVEVLGVEDEPGELLTERVRAASPGVWGCGGAVQGIDGDESGGPARVRVAGAAGVAQAAVALPGGAVRGGVVHRGRRSPPSRPANLRSTGTRRARTGRGGVRLGPVAACRLLAS